MVDRLEALLDRFPVQAQLLKAQQVEGDYLPPEAASQVLLHVTGPGTTTVTHENGGVLQIERPSVLLYARPIPHRLQVVGGGAVPIITARLQFDAGGGGPVAEALPSPLLLPLDELWGSGGIVQLLREEAFTERCGRRALLQSLFQALMVQLLRTLMENGQMQVGLLAGMGHPRLRHALVAMHEQPAQPWSLQALAECSGMSRSAFAEAFRKVVGSTPGHYLQLWRTRLVQQGLRRGHPLKRLAMDVGYGSEAALSRAFKAQTGQSPRQWKQAAG